MLVVNHALLVSDFNAGNKVLPEYEYLVIDEAHHLEDVATDQLGFRTGPGEYLEFLDRLSQDGAGRQQGALPNLEAAVSSGGPLFALHNQVLQHVAALKAELTPARNRVGHLFSLLADYLRQHGQGSAEYSRRVRLTGGARRQPLWSPVEQAWEDAQLTFQAIQRHLEHLHTSMEDSTGSTIDEYDDRITEIEGLHFTCQQLLDRGNAVIAHADPECVTWLATTGQSDGVGLFAAPIEVGPALNRELFSKKTSVILTSATLRTGDDFEYIKGRLGLEMPRELAVDSSFPYRDAALLLATLDLPEPHRPDHAMMLEQALGDLCVASQGRALVLFTSHAALQSAYRTLKQLLEPQSITVLAQGMSGNTQRMLERLRAQPQTVLLGTNSLWEGIDVVGEALSLLVITRLPFSVPTDPVFAARSERFEDPFREYAVPQAVLRFRQGFGRLIRSKTDRGVAVVLDPRASSKNYGAAFFQPLPPVTVRRCALREAPKMVAQWLAPAKG